MSPMNPRLLRPTPSGLVDPRKIANLQLWLDASSVAGMRQLSDGTTAVTADDDQVGYWPDLSGNGYHATQSTTGQRPKYKVGVRNGRSVLRFDGTDDTYRVQSLPLDATISMFVVAQFNTAGVAANTTGNLFIEHSANSNLNSGFSVAGQSSAPQQINRTNAPGIRWAQTGVASWLGTAWSVAEFRFTPGAAVDDVLAYWKDGTLQANNAAVQFAGTATSGRSVTADLFIGSRNQASIFSNGDYAEFLIYNRPLTDPEHTAVRRYLGKKWGITVT